MDDCFEMPIVRRTKNKVDIALGLSFTIEGIINESEKTEKDFIQDLISFLESKKEKF